jgi:hypothetical protein
MRLFCLKCFFDHSVKKINKSFQIKTTGILFDLGLGINGESLWEKKSYFLCFIHPKSQKC